LIALVESQNGELSNEEKLGNKIIESQNGEDGKEQKK
jgi:hypothetical protein